MGRPAHEPTPMSRRNVEALAGYGVPEVDIAGVIGIDPKTLRRHYPQELRYGHVKANAKVAENLYRKATGEGREAVTAAIFWLKTRARWKETTVQESEVTHRYVVRVPTPCRDGDEWMRRVAWRRDGLPPSERPPMRTIPCRRD